MSNIELGIAPDWAVRARELFGERGEYGRPVLLDPEDEGWWLRDFDATDTCSNTDLSVYEVIKQAEPHFSVLKDAGIGVPPRAYHIDSFGALSPPGALMRVRAIRAGFEVDTDDLLEIPEAFVQPLRIARRGLIRYYRWVKDTKQPFFLNDIATSRQYMYGRLGYHLEHSLQLIDVEPRMSRVNSIDWQYQQKDFWEWAATV
jgi:hypothetical protein